MRGEGLENSEVPLRGAAGVRKIPKCCGEARRGFGKFRSAVARRGGGLENSKVLRRGAAGVWKIPECRGEVRRLCGKVL